MFKDKEEKLLEAMKEQNFEPFDSAAEACEFIEDRLTRIVGYVSTVAAQVATAPMLRFRYEGQDLVKAAEERNERRIDAHNLCIDSFNQLNRLCNSYGIEAFTDTDLSDRRCVAEEAGKYFDECYNLGLKENYFENAVDLASKTEYDANVVKGRWSRNVEDVEVQN